MTATFDIVVYVSKYILLHRHVWLIPQWTQVRDHACTHFEVQIVGSSLHGLDDLAKRAGGYYRYLIPRVDVHIPDKIRKLALYRKTHLEGPVNISDIEGRGYTDFSTNINAWRGGKSDDYLSLVWQARQ